MAEAIAAIAVASSIVQLVDFGSKLVSRLNEFQSSLEDTPKSFRQIKDELPLLLDILNKTKEAVDAGLVKQETATALLPVIKRCREQVDLLDTVLTKILPAKGDSRMKRGKKAISSSLFQDDKVDRITSSTQRNVHLLTLYHAAASSTLKPKTDENLMEIRRWLSAPDPSTNYQKALRQHLQNTGLWFLQSKQYTDWKTDAASFLWLYGIPGCGKTILSSAVIQDILQECCNDPTKVVGYYYFTFNDSQKQTAELMVKSLITQLSQHCIQSPTALLNLFSTHLNGQRQPSSDELLQVLRQLIQDFSASFIVLDALDECTEREELLLPILEEIARWRLENLHVIVTSRYEADILSSLGCLIPDNSRVPLESKEVDPDITCYVRHRLSADRNLRRWQKQPEVHREIEAVLTEKAHGMWRWAACQLDTLGKCVNRYMVQKSLRDLPRTLDETYDRILCAIDDDYRDYALCILKWLAFSARPLRMTELAETIAITFDDTPMFDKDKVLPEPTDVLSICSSLVTTVPRAPDAKYDDEYAAEYDDESSDEPVGDGAKEISDESAVESDENTIIEAGKQYLTLAHYSVKEYLISERIKKNRAAKFSIQKRAANTFIAESCLIYLLQFQDRVRLPKKIRHKCKLAYYAATFLSVHFQEAELDASLLQQLVKKLFTPGNYAYVNMLRMAHPDDYRQHRRKTLDNVLAPIYYVSYFGLSELVKLWITDESTDVNVQGGCYGNALQAASSDGHEKIVERLLEAGADVNVQGGYYGNALQAASLWGHKKIVERLLEAGADVNAQGGYYSNALQAASSGGHEKIVERLLETGADVNAQGGCYGNALQAASSEGHEKIVERLLEAGADVNAQGRYYDNALQTASFWGHEKIVERLLEAGADVNAQGGYYGNALETASRWGHKKIVKLLLDAGAKW